MDCSEECGGPRACAEACGPGVASAAQPPFLAPHESLVPGVTYLIRPPVVAESDSCAAAGCTNLTMEGVDAKKGIAVLFPTNSSASLYRVTVQPPWAFGFPQLISEGDPVCGGQSMNGAEMTCVTRHAPGPGEIGLWIVTSEPTASSALVTVEVGDETLQDCP